jgi:hypothetical protein
MLDISDSFSDKRREAFSPSFVFIMSKFKSKVTTVEEGCRGYN